MLDIGCGTGADAVHLAARGVEVVGIDPSEAMIDLASLRAADLGLARRTRFIRASAEDLASPDTVRDLELETLDGVLCNFGVLNCLEPGSLRPLAAALAPVCRPGAVWASVTMGRFCAWEGMWYGFHGKFGRAFRRMAKYGVEADLGAGPLRVYYHGSRSIADAAQSWFHRTERAGIGALIPPTFAGGWLGRRPNTLENLARLERRIAAFPPVVGAADHVLLKLVRS